MPEIKDVLDPTITAIFDEDYFDLESRVQLTDLCIGLLMQHKRELKKRNRAAKRYARKLADKEANA